MGSRRNPAINQSSAIRRLPAIEYEYENKIEDENNEVEQEKVEAFVADHAEQLRVRTWVARENGSASRFRQAFPSTFSKNRKSFGVHDLGCHDYPFYDLICHVRRA